MREAQSLAGPGAGAAHQAPPAHGYQFPAALSENNMALAENDVRGNAGGFRKKLLIGASAAGLLLIVSLFWIVPAVTSTGHEERKGDEPRDRPVTSIHMKVMKPLPGMERTTMQPATVQSFDVVDIYSYATGKLKDQTVDIDSRVKKGGLLATIDAPDVIADRNRAEASWLKSKAEHVQAVKEVDVVETGLKVAKKMIDRRKAQMHAAAAFVKYRKAELARYKKLLEDRAIDARVVDEESDRYESAEASLEAAKEGVDAAVLDVEAKAAQLLKARSDVDEAVAAVAVAKAQLDKAEVMVGFTQIKADFDGVITQRNYTDGAYIRSVDRGGQQPLLVIKSVDKFRVVTMVPDVDVPFVSIGDPAALVIPTIKPEPFIGKVSRTARSEDYKSRTMRVEVDLQNTKDEILRDNMYGYITIHLTKAPKPQYMLPSRTVHEDLQTKERFVYVIRQNRAHKQVVTIGPDDGKLVGIMGGLKADDQVVIQDNGLLNEGTEVEPELVAAAHAARQ